MTRNELVAAVALGFIKEQLQLEPHGSFRICMLGLESSLVRSIAQSALVDSELSSTVLVKISSHFDPDGSLPGNVRDEQSITHWRHCRLPEGKRAVLFAASQGELQRNDKSVEKVSKIETDTLRAMYPSWIQHVGLTSKHIDEAKRAHLISALQSADGTHVARTIESFADFVLAISEAIISKGLPIQKAIDFALPSLRLPRNAGRFDQIPERKRKNVAEWNKVFRRLQSRVRPLLVRETERGEPIPEDQLKSNFEDLKDLLDSSAQEVIEEFIGADLKIDGWSEEQKALVNLNWLIVSGLFDGVSKSKTKPLGDRTIDFFDDEFDDSLDDDDRELLVKQFPKEPSEDLQEFFESHREHLTRDKKISTAWEKYIYRNPKTYKDFLVGLLSTIEKLRQRSSDEDLIEKKLVVHIPKAREKSFWHGKNARVVRYFAFRYRGLDQLLGDDAKLDFGKLQQFYGDNPDPELLKVKSASKEARTIKFEVILDPTGSALRLIFYWEMPVSAIATSLPDDLVAIANVNAKHALLPTADIARQSANTKGGIQRISIEDMNTIRDATNSNDGRLVAPNSESGDRTSHFKSALKELSSVLDEESQTTILDAFERFHDAYTKAIRDWVLQDGAGISSEAFELQAQNYGQLLSSLIEKANYDLAREKLWHEVLFLGVANVGAGAPAAIITPWHPLRLAEIGIKAKQACRLIKNVLQADQDDIYRADLLFGQISRELTSNYYPEICVGYADDQPVFLFAAENGFDYTLAEPPLRSNDARFEDALDVEPGVAAKAFSAVGEQYLKLLPHERSNFSVVLYNAESKALPSALARELSNKIEQENELQCDLLLTHSKPARIRRIYEQQNLAVNDESGSILASEAARSFLSRLRVGLLDQAQLPTDETERAADLVALQDVIARNAKLVWKRAPAGQPSDLSQHVPARWSKRRPIGAADTATSVYLACPAQPEVGQTYINTIQWFLDGDNSIQEDVIPAREVNFRDSEISEVFDETHKIGEWVVNFDPLVDRRLLSNNGINVIRHVHDRMIDRNVIVSTTSKPRLLNVLLKNRLEKLSPLILRDNEDVISRLVDQATSLSGQVVMRAARYGQYANELLGIVLSMEKIRSDLGGSKWPIGWYFLDDFASWFGQSEEQIADIMAIAPRVENGKPILYVAISEAKFVNSQGYKSHERKSAKQLKETVSRIGRALDPQHKRIDRELWLHRLGDFMIEGMEPFKPEEMNGWNLHAWSDQVRRDEIPIQLAGFSHVFVHDDFEYVDSGGDTPLKGMPHCVQQVFDKTQVTNAFIRYAREGQAFDTENIRLEGAWADALVSSGQPTSIDRSDENSDEKPRQLPSDISSRESEESSDQRSSTENGNVGKQSGSGKAVDKEHEERASTKDEASKVGRVSTKWPSQELANWVELGQYPDEDDEDSRIWLDSIVVSLQRALRGYEMTAELVGARLTPNAALIRFRGSDNLTVPKVEKRRQELLTSHAIEVINVLPAPLEVVIMVARPSRTVLRLRDMWKLRDLPSSAPDTNTSLLLGSCESDGNLLYLNVGDGFSGFQPHGPHTLIAGETGSGKGVLVQCLLLDICATNAPANARIHMIDPKAGIDFPWLRQMPHLEGNLITDREEAVIALEALVYEMERRNHLLAAAGVTKLSRYNQLVSPGETLPRIWLFHDELADWMLIKEYNDAVELNVNRLGVKARAAGINLVLVTQRPDKDALPMQLRANLTNRLVLKVADKRNSILVLDEPGAERLLGRGHLAAKLSGEGKLIFSQVPFADEDEIAELAGIIRRAWEGG